MLVLRALLVLILVTALRVVVPLLQGSPKHNQTINIDALDQGIYTAVSLAATAVKTELLGSRH